MSRNRFVFPALVAAAALALTGCATTDTAADDTGTDTGTDTLRVVATTTQVGDFTRNVVGDVDGVSVTQLIRPNQSAHSYDPSVADLTALGEADVLVINGVGLEEWLDDAISASGFDGVTIDSDEGIEIQEVAAGADHESDEGDHSDEPATTDAGEHGHEGGDPHIWTDVSNAQAMVGTIAAGLGEARADLAADFDANGSAYAGRLAQLDEWIRTNVEAVPADRRLFVSNHDAFGYLTAAYDITYVGSIIPSFDDNAEPSAAAIDALVAAITETGVKAVFSEASISPKAADTIAREAGVTVYSGDAALYSDSLGARGSDGATYIGSQLHNLTAMLESWGTQATPVPADLR